MEKPSSGADSATARSDGRNGTAPGTSRSGPSGRWLRRIVQLLLTVTVTWFIVDRLGITADDLSSLDDRWLSPAWEVLVLASLVLLLGFFLSSSLWGRMVRELGGPSLGLVSSASIYFTANLGRYVPGKVLQLAGLAYLAGRRGVPAGVATASAMLVQAVSLGGAAVVGAWALVSTPGVAEGWGGWAVATILGLVAVVTFPPVFERVLDLWFRTMARLGRGVRAEGGRGRPSEPNQSSAGSERTHPPGVVAAEQGRRDDPAERRGLGKKRGRSVDVGFGVRWILLFAVNWLLYGAAVFLLARSFDVSVPFAVLVPAFAAAYLLGYLLIFAPAGIGVREGFLIAFLQPTTGPAAATALAILARGWMTVLEILPALLLGGAHVLATRRTEGRSR